MSEDKRLILRSSPENSVTWLYVRQDGSLVVEWYDYSSDAQCHFGNDVAFLLVVASTDKAKIWSLLAEQQNSTSDAAMSDDALLMLIQERFESYHIFKQWVISNNLPHEAVFDSWA